MVYNQLALWAFHDGQLGDAVEAATAAQRVWVRCLLRRQALAVCLTVCLHPRRCRAAGCVHQGSRCLHEQTVVIHAVLGAKWVLPVQAKCNFVQALTHRTSSM